MWNRALSATEVKALYDYGNQFTSGVRDVDFNARRYDPETMLFSQGDLIIADAFNPQNLNPYMFELGNTYKNTDPTGRITISPLLLGENTISPTPYILGRNELMPVPEGFKGGQIDSLLKNQGFKDISEFGSKSPIQEVTNGWKYGGLAREVAKGVWDAIRWDVAHRGTPFKHSNVHRFEWSDSLGRLKDINVPGESLNYLNHAPYYSTSLNTNYQYNSPINILDAIADKLTEIISDAFSNVVQLDNGKWAVKGSSDDTTTET